jgi:hypothetical protein
MTNHTMALDTSRTSSVSMTSQPFMRSPFYSQAQRLARRVRQGVPLAESGSRGRMLPMCLLCWHGCALAVRPAMLSPSRSGTSKW